MMHFLFLWNTKVKFVLNPTDFKQISFKISSFVFPQKEESYYRFRKDMRMNK